MNVNGTGFGYSASVAGAGVNRNKSLSNRLQQGALAQMSAKVQDSFQYSAPADINFAGKKKKDLDEQNGVDDFAKNARRAVARRIVREKRQEEGTPSSRADRVAQWSAVKRAYNNTFGLTISESGLDPDTGSDIE